MVKDLIYSLSFHADRNAFCINDQFYTYGELRDHIVSIIGEIQDARSEGSSRNIAVVCSNDIRMYASLFAIWFTGCAYVPLGFHNPVERNRTILKDAAAEIIISSMELDAVAYAGYKVIEPAREVPGSGDREIHCPDADKGSLAYILFTSGSTGLPKGVPISHENIGAFLDAFGKSPFKVVREDRCLQMFELTFDVSISSYLPALLCGACVYTVPNDGVKYMHVLRVLTQYKLTSIQIVPSIIKLAKPLLKRIKAPEVRNCILTGEATMTNLVTEWRSCVPNAAIYNYYGPTEATIYCSYLHYAEGCDKHYNGMIAIGKAFSGMELLIVDESGNESAVNEKGELLIGGGQVTPGYINNPEKNRLSFVERMVGGRKVRFYRSGDMCYKDAEGDIFYCGRFDNQVKIQGFRIELSEIEYLVRDKFSINNVVIVSENEQGANKLILVLEGEQNGKLGDVSQYLKTKLPEYMVPADVQSVDEFPLNSSGKTDRKAIKEILNDYAGARKS